jgi:hypothetical protein
MEIIILFTASKFSLLWGIDTLWCCLCPEVEGSSVCTGRQQRKGAEIDVERNGGYLGSNQVGGRDGLIKDLDGVSRTKRFNCREG